VGDCEGVDVGVNGLGSIGVRVGVGEGGIAALGVVAKIGLNSGSQI
jgi:hypothetical protein